MRWLEESKGRALRLNSSAILLGRWRDICALADAEVGINVEFSENPGDNYGHWCGTAYSPSNQLMVLANGEITNVLGNWIPPVRYESKILKHIYPARPFVSTIAFMERLAASSV